MTQRVKRKDKAKINQLNLVNQKVKKKMQSRRDRINQNLLPKNKNKAKQKKLQAQKQKRKINQMFHQFYLQLHRQRIIYLKSRDCVHHKSPFIYYCETCEELICSQCTVYGPHNNHVKQF